MINKCIFIGNVTADPEIRATQAGASIANFTVACGEKYKDKSGEMQEQTEFVRVVAFGKLGEICGQYLQKGSKVYIEGRMQTRKWQDQSGNDRYSTEIIAREMKMLSPKQSGGGSSYGPPSTGEDVPMGGSNVPF